MYCVSCNNQDTSVIDSRLSTDGKIVRRRRLCNSCGYKFTTFENIGIIDILVEKSNNKREQYRRQKLQDSLLRACNKRNISTSQITEIVNRFELEFSGKESVTSKEIGKYILASLKELDEVAYIRYASVNLNFESVQDFSRFISREFPPQKEEKNFLEL